MVFDIKGLFDYIGFSIEWIWNIFVRCFTIVSSTQNKSGQHISIWPCSGYEVGGYTDPGACGGVVLLLPVQGSGWDICSVHYLGGKKYISTSLRCLNSKMCCYLSPGENFTAYESDSSHLACWLLGKVHLGIGERQTYFMGLKLIIELIYGVHRTVPGSQFVLLNSLWFS